MGYKTLMLLAIGGIGYSLLNQKTKDGIVNKVAGHNTVENDANDVERASMDSFPASDPPAWTARAH